MTLSPYEGGHYTDVNGNDVPATGVFTPLVGTMVLFAVVLPGYVFSDGTSSKDFTTTFTDVPC
ncbi:MAG: hypothetical protein ABIZ34_05965 [Candidatus Limnocylindrales bacterium]